jgi:hypothetical protein
MSASAEARLAALRAVPAVGGTGVELLRDARVHVVGAGALAGPALLVLAQAGVGTLYLDDGDDVSAADADGWLLAPRAGPRPRLLAALEAVREASALAEVRPWATGTLASATLVCAPSESVAHAAAEQARHAGLPHVVALADGDGGEIVTVPVGAPCLACASPASARVRATATGAATLGTLAALELLLLVARLVPQGAGRRIELVAGVPQAAATARRPGCDCRIAY